MRRPDADRRKAAFPAPRARNPATPQPADQSPLSDRRLYSAAVLLGTLLLCVSAGAATQPWRILALRADFPPGDPEERSVTGTGRFDLRSHDQALQDYALPFDTPPHDRAYFEHHLQALANYYDTVSAGRVSIEYAVYPRAATAAYTMPYPMLHYGTGRTADEIGERWIALLRHTIDAAAADPQGPRFAEYNSFLVFHAGVGHESGRLNDIRSVFLSAAEIDRLAGGPLPTGQGETAVRTAWILPETPSFTGRAGLNGLLAKFFGYQLGLPGLSNFAGGLPAVGGWSLMDVGANQFNFVLRSRPGQTDSLAAGVGFVPPHPMAWSQIRLGWMEPLTVQRDTTVAIQALDRGGTQPRAVRIPLNHDQYLLLENRQRRGQAGVPSGVATPFTDTTNIAWLQNSQIQFSRPDSSGVWLRVDAYDAFVPGSGVLVWSVDNSVVECSLRTGAINDDPIRPGIVLIEADGYRDIGQPVFQRLDQIEGSPDDPFHAAGQNRLGTAGGVAVRTPQGWDAGVEIEVLDEPADEMRVRIAFPRQLAGWPQAVTGGQRLAAADMTGDGIAEWITGTHAGVKVWSGTGQRVHAVTGGRLLAAGPATTAGEARLFVHRDDRVEAWTVGDSAPRWQTPVTAVPAAAVLAPLGSHGGQPVLALSWAPAEGAPAFLWLLDAASGVRLGDHAGMGPALTAADWRGTGDILLSDGRMVLTGAGVEPHWEVDPQELHQPVGGDFDGSGADRMVRVDAGAGVWLQAWDTPPRRLTRLEQNPVAAPVLGDVDGDGRLQIVLTTRDGVQVLRADGITQAGFPVRLPRYAELGPLTHAPALADLDADGAQEILLATDRGIMGLDAAGQLLAGFPLLTAGPVVDGPVLADTRGDGYLEIAALTDSGLYVWAPAAVAPRYAGTRAEWPQAGATAAGTYAGVRVTGSPEPDAALGLLVPGRTYCYPNPVGAEGTAHLRFRLNRPATVQLTVFDAIGSRITEVVADGELDGPDEHELVWSVAGYDSGVYLCRLRVRGAGGAREETFVKMAVKR